MCDSHKPVSVANNCFKTEVCFVGIVATLNFFKSHLPKEFGCKSKVLQRSAYYKLL